MDTAEKKKQNCNSFNSGSRVSQLAQHHLQHVVARQVIIALWLVRFYLCRLELTNQRHCYVVKIRICCQTSVYNSLSQIHELGVF